MMMKKKSSSSLLLLMVVSSLFTLLVFAHAVAAHAPPLELLPESIGNGNQPTPIEIEDVIVEKVESSAESNNVKGLLRQTLEDGRANETYEENGQPMARISYTGNQLWKIRLADVNQTKVLADLKKNGSIKAWGGNSTCIDILVKPDAIEIVSAALAKEHIKYEILMQDVQKAIDEENPKIEDETEDRQGHRLTWQSYHRIRDIYGFLDYIGKTYPDICSVKTIGTSVQGQPIKLLKVSNGNPNNKAVWIDGGIHAREWITPATVTYIINNLVLNYENEPEFMRNLDWYILPVANPDGYEYTHMVDRLWRKNRARSSSSGQCTGTDLNRNFGYRWGGTGSSRNPCTETYGGSGPFSEPETAAIQRFISNTKAPWKAYISFHSYGQYILYPWGYGRVVPPDYKDLEMVGRKAAEAIRAAGGLQYTVGPAANTLYPAAGGSDDWAKGTMKMKYAYTFELRDNGRYGFVLPASHINPTAEEALAAVRVIAEYAYKA